MHVFGLWEETGVPRESWTNRRRACEVHTEESTLEPSNHQAHELPGAPALLTLSVPLYLLEILLFHFLLTLSFGGFFNAALDTVLHNCETHDNGGVV